MLKRKLGISLFTLKRESNLSKARLPFLILVFITLVLCLFRPIYTDETAFRIYNSRALSDGQEHVPNLYAPHCPSSENVEVPYILRPARLISSSAFTNLNSPLLHRSLGLAAFIGVLGLLFLIGRRLRSYMSGLAEDELYLPLLAPFLVGVAPFLFVTSRPEPFILLILYSLLLLVVTFSNRTLSRKEIGFIFFFFIAISTFLFPLHPKTLLFLPFLMAAAVVVLGLKKPLISLVTSTTIVYVGAMAFKLHNARLKCPENREAYDALTNILQLTPEKLLSVPSESLGVVLNNFLSFKRYFMHILYTEAYQSNWLIRITHPTLDSTFNRLTLFLIILFFLGATFLLFKIIQKKLFKDGFFWLFITLIAALLGMCAIQKIKTFYETALFLGLIPALYFLPLFALKNSSVPLFMRKVLKAVNFLIILNLIYLAFNSIGSWEKPYGAGFPTVGKESTQITMTLQSMKNQCFNEEKYPSGSVFMDTFSYYAVVDEIYPRMLNFITPIENNRKSIFNKKDLMPLPQMQIYIGECQWLDWVEDAPPVILKQNVGPYSFCCASRKSHP